jgi:hypothetical protein
VGLSLLKTVNYRESLGIFPCDRRTVGRHDHPSICSRFRTLAPASRPSVAGTRACRPATSVMVLRRQRPRRLRFHSADRLLWGCLYRAWPRVLDALVLVKPATVVKWHRKGFRIYRQWRSRCPRTPQDKRRNPGPDPSDEPHQAALGRASHRRRTTQARHRIEPGYFGRHLSRRPNAPSPTWRSFLRNHMTVIAAVDMCMVATATFKCCILHSAPCMP